MPRYLIEVTHGDSKQACMQAMRVFLETGSHFLTHADWGCPDDEHKAWIIAELEDKDQARNIVPPIFRGDTRIVELAQLDPHMFDEAAAMHKD